jgi:hypothetical protein
MQQNTVESTQQSAARTVRICEGCGELIPTKRLLAVPHAHMCVECQGKNDVPRAAEAKVNLNRMAFTHEPNEPVIRRSRTTFATYGLPSVMR